MKRLLVFVFAVTLLGSCDSNSKNGEFIDERDGKKYKTIKIGEQVWMAENLAYEPSYGSYWAYGNDNTKVSNYGYLYNWKTAKMVCPTGWHLPSDIEWAVLEDYLGGVQVAGTKMKSTSGWQDGGNGTNESGFNGLPGGNYDNPNFYSIGNYGYWWSSSELNTGIAWKRLLNNSNGELYRGYNDKTNGLSVRCIKDFR